MSHGAGYPAETFDGGAKEEEPEPPEAAIVDGSPVGLPEMRKS